MKIAVLLLVLVLAGGMAWIRLAPSDPARWHVSPAPPEGRGGILVPPGTDPVIAGKGAARAALTVFGEAPETVLARLDAIAMDTPRTTRLSGRPEEGRITWITRSAFFGFPDYTTAEARADGPATELVLYARLRFGRDDFGVNTARLRDWIARLAP